MARFEIGDQVVTVENKTFDGFVGQVEHIDRKRFSTTYWVLFPGHPWTAIERGPYAFAGYELEHSDG